MALNARQRKTMPGYGACAFIGFPVPYEHRQKICLRPTVHLRGKHNGEVKRKTQLALKLLFYGAIGCGTLVLAAYLWQRRMIYFPDSIRPPESHCRALGLRPWPDSTDSYRGFIGLATPTGKKGLVVVFHGNAGGAWDRAYYVHALAPLGYRVVLAEYPGYGGRPGGLGERRFVEDAKETARSAFEVFGGPLFLVGESLGSGVAAAVAADPAIPVEGLIMITPWDSLPAVAQGLYWNLPIQKLVRDKYDNIRNLGRFTRTLWIFAGAGHNSWPTGPNEAWWREAMDFLSAKQKKRGRP